MLKLVFAMALGAAIPAGQAQEAAVQPSVDSAAERVTLRNLSACLAKSRPRWARQALAKPYLSPGQESLLRDAMSGGDNCLNGGSKLQVSVRSSGMVSGLAEHFLTTELDRVGLKRVSAELVKVTSLNASEDFALCVAARNPKAAQGLAMSEPGSDAERQSAESLAKGIQPCLNPGETSKIDLQSFRALAATALYRGLTSAQGSRG
jgi:hypothetical protein